jgi:co-chaperonin GroES (HSP10)
MFKPLGSLCTIVLDPKAKETPGGLVLPDNFGEIFLTGVVRAVGPGGRIDAGVRNTPDVEVGDRVMIAQHVQHGGNGQSRVIPFPTIKDDGVDCIICSADELLGVVESTLNVVAKISPQETALVGQNGTQK